MNGDALADGAAYDGTGKPPHPSLMTPGASRRAMRRAWHRIQARGAASEPVRHPLAAPRDEHGTPYRFGPASGGIVDEVRRVLS